MEQRILNYLHSEPMSAWTLWKYFPEVVFQDLQHCLMHLEHRQLIRSEFLSEVTYYLV